MKSHVTTAVVACVTTLLVTSLIGLWMNPAAVQAQGRFGGLQFARSDGALYFFDTRSGDLWIYDEGRKVPLWHFRIDQMGGPVQQIKLTPQEGAGGAPQVPATPKRP